MKLFNNEFLKTLKKYERRPLKFVNVTPAYDFNMDCLRWHMLNADDPKFKQIFKRKPKRKLFYKFVRRLPR